jgi:hypothetical protein
MKQLKTFETFTTHNKDSKDIQIDNLKDELKTEKTRSRQMESSIKSIHTIITKYQDFISQS